MATIVSGAAAAKTTGKALAVIYNHIRAGRVKNHKAGGWPTGKGVEVDIEELQAVLASHSRAPRSSGPKAPREGKTSRKAREEAIHEALDQESEDRKAERAKRRAQGDEGNTVRLRRFERGAYVVCPVRASHGPLYKMDRGKTDKGPDRYHCSHVEHDGRGRTHPAGPAPMTKNVFTADELNIPQPIGQLGEIMLGWIMEGRSDLSESLEAWMEKNKLDVWIPVR